MTAYVAIKFKKDGSNKDFIERISCALERNGIKTTVFHRDREHWGAVRFDPCDLMKEAAHAIDACDVVIVEFSEKGVGLGIEAGYAYATGKPVHVIAQVGSEISDTLRGVASSVTFYENPENLDLVTILN